MELEGGSDAGAEFNLLAFGLANPNAHLVDFSFSAELGRERCVRGIHGAGLAYNSNKLLT